MRFFAQSCLTTLIALVVILSTVEAVRAQVTTAANTKIVFQSSRDGNAQIYIMDSSGRTPTRLTNNSWEDEDPIWSPDGRKIMFVSTRLSGDTNHQIFLMNSDGTNQRKISDLFAGWQKDRLCTALSEQL